MPFLGRETPAPAPLKKGVAYNKDSALAAKITEHGPNKGNCIATALISVLHPGSEKYRESPILLHIMNTLSVPVHLLYNTMLLLQ